MTTDRVRRKLELAADRELERMTRGEDMATRARRNVQRGDDNARFARSRVQHFQQKIRDLDLAVTAAGKLP